MVVPTEFPQMVPWYINLLNLVYSMSLKYEGPPAQISNIVWFYVIMLFKTSQCPAVRAQTPQFRMKQSVWYLSIMYFLMFFLAVVRQEVLAKSRLWSCQSPISLFSIANIGRSLRLALPLLSI